MLYAGTDPESYITECTSVYEEKRYAVLRQRDRERQGENEWGWAGVERKRETRRDRKR